MSNIIKAEYVIFDNRSKRQIQKSEQTDYQVINTPREDLFKVYNQREIILEEASDEAMKIIDAAKRNAQTEIAEYKNRGYEDGYNTGIEAGKNKGYTEGYEAGQARASEIQLQQNKEKLKELAEMVEIIENEKQKIITKYESELTKLSIDIAEKIIRNEIDTKDNAVLGIIKDVIKDYRNAEWIKLYISSKDDVITIQADKELINKLNKISKDVKIEVLDELEKGSVIVESADGIVEASIDTQLNNLKEMVLNKNAG